MPSRSDRTGTPDLPPSQISPQLALLTHLFHVLHGAFQGIPAEQKPWDGSFSTFESVDETRGNNDLPQIIFKRPSSTSAGAGMARSYVRLSPQSAQTWVSASADIQAVVKVLACPDEDNTLWATYERFPHDKTFEVRFAHLLGREVPPDQGQRVTGADTPARTADVSDGDHCCRPERQDLPGAGGVGEEVVYAEHESVSSGQGPQLSQPEEAPGARVDGVGADPLAGGDGPSGTLWVPEFTSAAPNQVTNATGNSSLGDWVREATFHDGASPWVARIMALAVLVQLATQVYLLTRK